jgi:hypothetical protein
MSAYIPIYAQYYDNNNNIVTKEISYQGSEIGIHVTIDDVHSSIKIRYYNSKIKMAASMTREWANDNNINVNFASFIFTSDALPEWWTFQPKEPSYNNNYYESQILSTFKKSGVGIIIRAGNLPWIDNTSDKKKFKCELIPL